MPISQAAFSWTALCVATLCLSSGVIWFSLILVTPPILKACWRLTATALLMIPLLACELLWARRKDRLVVLLPLWRSSIPMVLMGGAVLGLYFTIWCWAIDHTSVPHAILFVVSCPLIIVVRSCILFSLALVIRRFSPTISPSLDIEMHALQTLSLSSSSSDLEDDEHSSLPIDVEQSFQADDDVEEELLINPPLDENDLKICGIAPVLLPTVMEMVGTLIGFSGVTLLVVGSAQSSEQSGETAVAHSPATIPGDLAALMAALLYVFYLDIGSKLRSYLPLFMFICPVTAVAAVHTCLFSLLAEPQVHFLGPVDAFSVFGWLADAHILALNLGSSFVAGIMGHSMMVFALVHVSPLIVGVFGLLQPLLSTTMGWLVGVAKAPGVWTLTAAPILLLGALLTIIGSRNSGFGDLLKRQVPRCEILKWCS